MPLLGLWGLISWNSDRQAQTRLEALSHVVLGQIDGIVGKAMRTAQEVASWPLENCGDLQGKLQQLTAMLPYYRAMFLIQDDIVYCSSTPNTSRTRLTTYVEDAIARVGVPTLYLVPGTPLVPDRAALIVLLMQNGAHGAMVEVDGQYIQDIIVAAGHGGDFHIALSLVDPQSSQSYTIKSPAIAWAATPSAHTFTVASDTYPISITTTLNPESDHAYRKAMVLYYGPLFLALSLLCAYGTRRYLNHRQSIAADIAKGMDLGEFSVHYQPVIDLRTGVCVGAEPLLRWHRPHTGTIRPDIFIPQAEESGLGVRLTRHLIGLIERDVPLLGVSPAFQLGINLMPVHLSQADVMSDLGRFVLSMQKQHVNITLEITEREVLADEDQVRANMALLRQAGARFAIDDFGTGHSSLAYLKTYAIDYLKIDKSFVALIDTDAVNAPLLDVIISLGPNLSIPLVAEGVETVNQANYLRERGVAYAQGYLFGKPMSAGDFSAWLRQTGQSLAHAAVLSGGSAQQA
jgi:sensor c-di-GMP phosphodiesterase-like protein